MYPRRMPKTMKPSLRLMRRPRTLLGAVSAT